MTDLQRFMALALHEQGYGYVRIGRALGISTSTARRYVKPGYEERQRELSREAKRRRTGVCERCGGETRYGGHVPTKICSACNATLAAERAHAKRGTGTLQTKILDYIGDCERRFGEISKDCSIPHYCLGQSLNRLVRYGILERPARGLYRVASTPPAAQPERRPS